MDYYAVLGPIDPQQERPGTGRLVPALGYLVQYERLIEKSRKGTRTLAEMTLLVEKFDQAELYQFEQQRELSITLLKDWLVRYKFKNWTKTETRGKTVTKAMRKGRAAQIAKTLNNTDRWHSHGSGITMDILSKDLNLKIEDFKANPDMDLRIRNYYKLMMDYRSRRGHDGVLHTIERYLPLVGG